MRSGMGTAIGEPYRNWLAASLLLVSWEDAVK